MLTMSNPRKVAAELEPNLDIPWSNRALMWPIFNVAAPLLFHPDLHFESGREGKEMWRDHVESDDPTLGLMSHAREADAVLMARIVFERALRGMRYETIVTAKEQLRQIPIVGFIVRKGGTSPVDRVFENPFETPEEKKRRMDKNLNNKHVGITVLRAGGNILGFPEGGTTARKRLPDGSFERVPRQKDEILPHQAGFANMVIDSPPDVRERLRLMTIVSRYGEGLLSMFHPTTVVMDPVRPVDGGVPELKAQSEALMHRANELAIEIDTLKALGQSR